MSFSDKLDEISKKLAIDPIDKPSNINIIINNRLVELRHEFNKRGINPEESELFFTIENAFDIMSTSAIIKHAYYTYIAGELLKLEMSSRELSLIFNKKINKKREELKQDKRIVYESYEDDANFIFRFDVGKDINELLEKTKNFSQQEMIFPKYMEDIVNPENIDEERFIHNCNVDLKKLGYNTRIPCKNNDNLDTKKETLFSYDTTLSDTLYRMINHVELTFDKFPIIRTVITLSLKDQLKEIIPNVINSIKNNDKEKYEELQLLISHLFDPEVISSVLSDYSKTHLNETKNIKFFDDLKEEIESLNFEDLNKDTIEKAKVKTL